VKLLHLGAAAFAATLAACTQTGSNGATSVVSMGAIAPATTSTSTSPSTVAPSTVPITMTAPTTTTATGQTPSAVGDRLLGATVPADTALYFHSTDPTWSLRSLQVAYRSTDVYGPLSDQSSLLIVGDGDLAERPRATVTVGPTGVLDESTGFSSATMGAVIEPAEVAEVAALGRTSWANDIPITELEWPARNGYTASMVAVGLGLDEAADLAGYVAFDGTTARVEVPPGYHLLGPLGSQALTVSAFLATDDVGMYVNCANDGEVGFVGLQMGALARTVTRPVAGGAVAQRADPAFGPAQHALDGAQWLMAGWWCSVWSAPPDPNGGGEVPFIAEREMEQFLASLALDDEASLRLASPGAELLLDAGEPAPDPTATTGPFSIGGVDASAVPFAQFTPDGDRIAVTTMRPGGPGSTVQFIDADTGAQLLIVPISAFPCPGLPISPDGRLLYDGDVLRNTITGAPEVTLDRGSGSYADFSPDGTQIVVIGRHGQASASVGVYSTSTGKLLSSMTTPDSHMMCPEFFPDGERILLPTLFPTTRVWDITGDQVVFTVSAEYAFPTIGDNGRVVAFGGAEPRLVDSTTGTVLGSLPGLPRLFSQDGQRVAVLPNTPDGYFDPKGSLVIWDVIARSELAEIPCDCQGLGGGASSDMSFNNDGSRIVILREGVGEVYDVATGGLISTLEVDGAEVLSVAYSSDGTRIVTANDNGTVRIWNDP
jgi:hypothetical protein